MTIQIAEYQSKMLYLLNCETESITVVSYYQMNKSRNRIEL